MNSDRYDIQNIFFLGIGGIGMSALARYFIQLGKNVAGYDKTASSLTEQLVKEGAKITHEDAVDFFNVFDFNPEDTLIVYTPAIPQDLKIKHYLNEEGFQMFKRSEVLGKIVQHSRGIAVAGTHGKTTTSSIVGHLLRSSSLGCNAFLGGITANYGTNVWFDDATFTVVEADEYDRSFLTLHPEISIVTSAEPDHLDIYKDENDFNSTFEQFISQTLPEGCCVLHESVRHLNVAHENKVYYSLKDPSSDCFAENIRISNGHFLFDWVFKGKKYQDISFSYPGFHNLENCIAALAVVNGLGVSEQEWRKSCATFYGVKRRFEKIYEDDKKVYIDDYAHHPGELKTLIHSLRSFYPDQKLTMIFQPHLFSRTRDFMDGFASELSQVDELLLMDIYPARELPIDGVDSKALLEKVNLKNKRLVSSAEIESYVKSGDFQCLVTAGAGDIDREVPKIKDLLTTKIMNL